MLYEIFLGLRYLKAKRKQAFISVITIISVVGVMVGVMALIVVLSVMNGFRADLMSKILGVKAHLRVNHYGGAFTHYEKVLKEINRGEGVIGTTPTIYSQVMVNSDGFTSGVLLRGVDTKTVTKVIEIEPMIKQGSLSSLDEIHNGLPGIIIGSELSKQIGAMLGDVLSVVSPQGRLTPVGRGPNSRRFRVTGLFNSGMYEFDLSMVFISIREAQELLGIGDRVTGFEVRVKDAYKSDLVGKSLQEILGDPYWVQDWKVTNRSLLKALELEKFAMFIILTMIVLVGALNIISTLVMVVMEKAKDIAILRAMGATRKSIMCIFVFQGFVVGLTGTIAGLLSGLFICHLLLKYKFIELPSDVYYISTLPVRVESLDVILVTLSAVLISFLATIYPSWHAARSNPLESLRYE